MQSEQSNQTSNTSLADLSSPWLFSCLFSYLLVCTRVVATGSLDMVFLLWNLWLAWIPFAISRYLLPSVSSGGSPLKLAGLLLLWLLFLPNSFYIVTDLFHLRSYPGVPRWFDLLLLFSFAWSGLLLGIISIQEVKTRLAPRLNAGLIPWVEAALMWLVALGIYIGRYLRYNSWDILVRPDELMSDLLWLVLHPLRNMFEWGMVAGYGMLLMLAYYSFDRQSPRRASSLRNNNTF